MGTQLWTPYHRSHGRERCKKKKHLTSYLQRMKKRLSSISLESFRTSFWETSMTLGKWEGVNVGFLKSRDMILN